MNNKMNYPKLEELETGSKIIYYGCEYFVIKELNRAYSAHDYALRFELFNKYLTGMDGEQHLYSMDKILNPDGSTLWCREKEFPQDGDIYYYPVLNADNHDCNIESCNCAGLNDPFVKYYKDNDMICKTESEAILKSEIMLDSIKKRWVPEDGDDCWSFRLATKQVYHFIYHDNYDVDRNYILSGNCFKTEQEAEANKDKVLSRFEFINNNCKED